MKKGILLFLLFLFGIASFQLFAQSNKVDSLKRMLGNMDDTLKVNVLNELTRALWYYQLGDAMNYNKRAIDLADSLSYQYGIAEANRCRGVILAFKNDGTGMQNLTKALIISGN